LPELKNKLEGTEGYDDAKRTNDVAKLLIMIRGYCCQFDLLSNEYMAIVAAIKNLFYFFQKNDQSNADYHEDFIAMLEVIEEYGGAGSMMHFPNMLKKEIKSMGTDLAKATSDQIKQAKKTMRDKFLAALMLSGANGAKYNDLKRNMKENFVTGTSTYPESPEAVLRILNAYQSPVGWNRRKQDAGAGTEEGDMFVQAEGGDDSWKTRINCHKCGKKGHIARECPKNKEKEEEQMHANVEQNVLGRRHRRRGEYLRTTQGEGSGEQELGASGQPEHCQPDRQPSISLKHQEGKKPATVHCNTGSTYSSLEGEFGMLTVKHNPRSIANVLSLHQAKDRHRVKYDSWDRGGVFQIHTQDGIVEFKPCERGLHYHDMSDDESNIGLMLVNTARGNFEGYTHKKIERVREARRIQGMIANPTEREFSGMVRKNFWPTVLSLYTM
jgi:hypothetical protein